MSAGDETKVANCMMTAGKNCMNDGTPKFAIAKSGLDQNLRLRLACTTFQNGKHRFFSQYEINEINKMESQMMAILMSMSSK